MDIAISWDPTTGTGDWSIVGGDLALGDDLTSAVMISIFTDRVAPAQPDTTDVAVGITAPSGPTGSAQDDRRGWWGDAFADVPIGSRLWELARAVKAGATAIPAEVKAVLAEALQWMVDDGVASSVVVDAWWDPANRQAIAFSVTVTEATSSTPITFRFSWSWQELS
ncbi:phage GP46 family protein [Gluconacetobacter diazotrophicus]|uniref:Putative bacteriophage related protein n=1 Tax=Gluconacetobacter diazotrophicus (strain ATCC 49037 / DSM 5601 / CCUG 37298 / CIP 103539 / LMG 7603 / PAl5) TaxID=272568 RepID=A9H6K5_GLUDA|nr:phage GP46 family protein [Gluconacetobacter diazotrophicus]CAP57509.1 putative bacteriophage related protein [Gluconacetobacter diazotrophicus PA1 5]